VLGAKKESSAASAIAPPAANAISPRWRTNAPSNPASPYASAPAWLISA